MSICDTAKIGSIQDKQERTQHQLSLQMAEEIDFEKHEFPLSNFEGLVTDVDHRLGHMTYNHESFIDFYPPHRPDFI